MAENAEKTDKEKNLKLQTYVGAEDKVKYLFLKERLTAGADIPDSQVLKLIINRLHALETEEKGYLATYTRHLERWMRRLEKEMRLKDEEWAFKITSSLRMEDDVR